MMPAAASASSLMSTLAIPGGGVDYAEIALADGG